MDTIPGDRPVATPLRAQQTTPYLEVPQLVVPVLSGSDLGQAASVCSPSAEEGDLGQVASEFSSSPGGGLGQVASDISPPVASAGRLMPASPAGGGSGQVASEPPSSPVHVRVASPVLGGERDQVALGRSPPTSLEYRQMGRATRRL